MEKMDLKKGAPLPAILGMGLVAFEVFFVGISSLSQQEKHRVKASNHQNYDRFLLYRNKMEEVRETLDLALEDLTPQSGWKVRLLGNVITFFQQPEGVTHPGSAKGRLIKLAEA